MPRHITEFTDILKPRREEFSNFIWVSKEMKTVVGNKQTIKLTPKQHKLEVLKNVKIQLLIDMLSKQENVSKDKLLKEVSGLLDEIGYNKNICIIRWLGFALTKIFLKTCKGIYVNEESITRIKSRMGNTPIIFVPSHRSYADFILMSYICFYYDIEIPAIAAGMDFHRMRGMGNVLRNTGAFFMRRSFNDDQLYREIFRQYIRQLVTQGELPIEFFIEGTRSRTLKSLPPKFGLLSMVLRSFFTAEVPDILFVPINISYDRVMEETLFAYELLGVPKPKESTTAFFKSLSIVKENYGNVYVEFGEPISVKSYFGDTVNRSLHNMKSLHEQEMLPQEKALLSNLAHDVVKTQQNHGVITTFNLIATILTNNLTSRMKLLKIANLLTEVNWLKTVMEKFGGLTAIKSLKDDVIHAINVHKNLIHIEDLNEKLLPNTDMTEKIIRFVGAEKVENTMSDMVPYIMLQIYVNPIYYLLINPALITVVLQSYGSLVEDEIYGHYQFLRDLLCREFVLFDTRTKGEFEDSLVHLQALEVIRLNEFGQYQINNDNKLGEVLFNLLNPFLNAYYAVCFVLQQKLTFNNENKILRLIQEKLKGILNTSTIFIHPYILNLNTLSNCLANLKDNCIVSKANSENGMLYCIDDSKITFLVDRLYKYASFHLEDEKQQYLVSKL